MPARWIAALSRLAGLHFTFEGQRDRLELPLRPVVRNNALATPNHQLAQSVHAGAPNDFLRALEGEVLGVDPVGGMPGEELAGGKGRARGLIRRLVGTGPGSEKPVLAEDGVLRIVHVEADARVEIVARRRHTGWRIADFVGLGQEDRVVHFLQGRPNRLVKDSCVGMASGGSLRVPQTTCDGLFHLGPFALGPPANK